MIKSCLKFAFLSGIAMGVMSVGSVAWACSPNLPNYGNCIRQQQQAQQMAIQQQAMQQQGYGGGYTQYQEPIDLSPPPILMNQGTFAVALSPSTGAVGASSFAWRDSETHYRLMVGHDSYALASCIAKTQGQPISSISLEQAEKFIKKHRKKSDCQVVKKSSPTDESLVAILRGKLPNGQYQLFMATRPSNDYLFSQQQPEFRSLLATCQASATDCEIIGQFGDKTEMY